MGLSNSSKETAQLINFNGILIPEAHCVVSANNRGFRYGDGLFETLLVEEGDIQLRELHFDRLLHGMQVLGFTIAPAFKMKLQEEILALCQANGHETARVRVMVFRGDGFLFDPADPQSNYIIQTAALAKSGQELDETGLTLGVFPDGRKSCDIFSSLKSNSCLIYTMAAQYARQQGIDDCLVLNTDGRLADSTMANFFYIRSGEIVTPPLTEGPISGVMRRYLLELLPSLGYTVHERPVGIDDLYQADEVFLTNAIRGIRWVRSLHHVAYSNKEAAGIVRHFHLSRTQR